MSTIPEQGVDGDIVDIRSNTADVAHDHVDG
jgi:hypothetical protein